MYRYRYIMILHDELQCLIWLGSAQPMKKQVAGRRSQACFLNHRPKARHILFQCVIDYYISFFRPIRTQKTVYSDQNNGSCVLTVTIKIKLLVYGKSKVLNGPHKREGNMLEWFNIMFNLWIDNWMLLLPQ